MNHSDAATLARTLINDNGLGHWVFEFDRAKCRAGACKHRRQTITLSQYYVFCNTDEDIKDTILHEIAHALAGPGHGHDNHWKAICIRIGAKPIRCYGNHVVMPKGQWVAVCNSCKKEFHYHRKPKCRYWCIQCGPGKGNLNYVKCNSKTPT